ncbi:hypothetical protein [Catenuloplanes atrovinosus]|uniref:Uncharacterized protein n=1 Tax=Catenuloplanes atrovinosus TaxID=137266 RepID=A0AAE4CFM9_9ACTN|nr:hypothetical protein [Catenuloplanes atrovinosus]MDR7279810.1 hypothetical protein [Catenuloplanes atrovinosus]
MRVTESVFEPGDLGLEIDVYSRDSDEPHHEVIISRRNLARMSRLTLSLMVRAVMDEAVPVRHFFDTAA